MGVLIPLNLVTPLLKSNLVVVVIYVPQDEISSVTTWY
jgi:hypothetical protein